MAFKTVFEEPEQPDPFGDFSLAQIIAWTHKSLGAAGLASFFSEFDSPEG
jgi:hypothetical protein